MKNLFGKNISSKKKLPFALVNIYGLGLFESETVCKKLGFNLNSKIDDLEPYQLSLLYKYIKNNYKTEIDLRMEKKKNVQDLLSIRTYKGLRHKYSYPVRGQRTKTNAKNSKKIKNL